MSAGIVIIGGGMAGARACIGLRSSGYEGAITLICGETLLPYDRPPLSKSMMVDESEPAPVYLADSDILKSLRVQALCGNPVTVIDRKAKQLVLADDTRLSYDKLLIATGARPRRLSIPGGELAYTLRNYADGDHLRNRLRASATAAIVGGGFIGLEMAASAVKLGCQVTLVETQPRILMRGVTAEIAAVIHKRHEQAGIKLEVGTALTEVTPAGVHLADGRIIEADVIIAGIGAVPETAIAEAAGLKIDNGIAVDGELRTSDPDIYAAGDCCSFPHPLFNGRRLRLEAWRNAQDQGTLAAENMLGAGKTYKAVPWFWSDQHDLSLQIAGLPDEATHTVRRDLSDTAFLVFHLNAAGTLVAASGVGIGNAVARDVKLAEMLIAKSAKIDEATLADPQVSLKQLLKG